MNDYYDGMVMVLSILGVFALFLLVSGIYGLVKYFSRGIK